MNYLTTAMVLFVFIVSLMVMGEVIESINTDNLSSAFCEDYFIENNGFAGVDYYCPSNGGAREFACNGDKCYFLLDSGESDE